MIGPIIASKQTGTRKIMNTDWPVENAVQRIGHRWMVLFGLCNGTPASHEVYGTKREAMAAAGVGPEDMR